MPAVETPAAAADASAGELGARPARSTRPGPNGLHELSGGALLYVPDGVEPAKPAPLVLMLHGAGGRAQHSLDLARAQADRHRFILLAPASRLASWDIISQRRYGADVAAIDTALRVVFASYTVDPKRIAIAGFSDGASYALSLGLTNGGLFSHVIAFAPGFMAPGEPSGRPDIFITHGTGDRVLPIDRCSRTIVPQLKRAGYPVRYVEFDGGHTVPDTLASEAFGRL
ncbi:alpha/beta hydrolase [Allosphingosinicella sp.]|jgi:predicted esterase|uniref:alpha/beta hydrolase n=1 Tax=Allosphingosinicella sp. TaxID=2823234 RepID=UPI003D704B12